MILLLREITLALILLICRAQVAHAGVCPSNPDTIKPCTCTPTTIACETTDKFELDVVLGLIAKGQDPQGLAFDTFILNASEISSLDRGVFHGLTFNNLKFIDCFRLSCVSSEAFAGLQPNVTSIYASDTHFDWFGRRDCSIFEAIRYLKNLKSLKIVRSKITEIPDNAFTGKLGQLSDLSTIDFSGGQGGVITQVGEKAFNDLPNVQLIDLSRHRISSIKSHGFEITLPIKNSLLINLEHNALKNNSFGNSCLKTNVKTELRLGENINLHCLNEEVFEPFLVNRRNKTEDNIIDLTITPIDCSKCNLWLLENEVNLNLRDKLKNILTSDGIDFWKKTKDDCSVNSVNVL
ncbi:leucine-rich repeat-containing G-protein coupled receptor 6-like [Oppia nitens]|uniref:leucine-rich repeat-containing G-protein coupled receptor 6-like n=1 Tax=Oppia nitens TaxID=1686743 RepID=UPI0023DC0A30|nr:leucine-rich repeat-containing G-protein coupled receptor 6-like [Oppia nitens]